jgi:hypothetical protein
MKWLGIGALAAVVAMMALTVAVNSANAGKAQVGLSHELYSFADGTFVVDYIVPSKGAGKMDLAVSHQCFSGDELVQDWTNRLYWSGKGSNKAGHWNTQVEGGNECVAVVIDLNQATSGELSLASSGYAEVSPRVRYMVE